MNHKNLIKALIIVLLLGCYKKTNKSLTQYIENLKIFYTNLTI